MKSFLVLSLLLCALVAAGDRPRKHRHGQRRDHQRRHHLSHMLARKLCENLNSVTQEQIIECVTTSGLSENNQKMVLMAMNNLNVKICQNLTNEDDLNSGSSEEKTSERANPNGSKENSKSKKPQPGGSQENSGIQTATSVQPEFSQGDSGSQADANVQPEVSEEDSKGQSEENVNSDESSKSSERQARRQQILSVIKAEMKILMCINDLRKNPTTTALPPASKQV